MPCPVLLWGRSSKAKSQARRAKSEAKTDTLLTIFHLSALEKKLLIYSDNANLTDMLTRGRLSTTFTSIFQNPAGAVTGSVLVQLGENDALWPASYTAGETAYWTSTASISVQTLPAVGHSFHLHLDDWTG
jgi:hypothetical protein